MGKGKHRDKLKPKSKQEAANYRYAIAHSQISPESTDQPLNDALRGSDEIYSFSRVHEEDVASVPTPKRIQFSRWLKENTWEILIGVILLGVVAWLCVSTIDLKVKSNENGIRIEQLKEQLEEIDNNAVNKDILQLEIESIEKDIDNLSIFKIDALNSRIEVLEQQIALINKN